MEPKVSLKNLDKKIQLMKQTATELHRMSEDFPALARNTERILASIRVLEINISDLVEPRQD
jgi:hypothetical protein